MTTIHNPRVLIDGSEPLTCTVNVNVEEVESTSGIGHAKPDASWFHLDMHSHFHAWAADGTLPTLRRTKKNNHRCVICNEKVEPRTVGVPASSFRTFVPGRKEIVFQVVSEYEPAPIVSVRVAEGPTSGFGIGRVAGHLLEGGRYEFEVVATAWSHRAADEAVAA